MRHAVAARQVDDPQPDDRFRGLYISDDQALRLLDERPPLPGRGDEPAGRARRARAVGRRAGGRRGTLRLRTLARSFGLTPLDVDVLLVALGPDLDPRLEPAYGYLHDDVTRRRASIGLALELCGLAPYDVIGRVRFEVDQPLVADRLVEVEEPDRPTSPARCACPIP